MNKPLGVADVEEITKRIHARQARFEEALEMSVGVVLLNYGENYVQIECIGGEWTGTKGELLEWSRSDQIPHCPSGHPLLEVSRAPRLALVDVPE